VAKRLRFADLGDQPREQRQQQQQGQQQQQQQQQQQRQPQLTQRQQPQAQDSLQPDALTRWQGVAKKVAEGLKSDSSLQGKSWPCLKLYLTGECGEAGCKNCTKNGLQGRGDPSARAAALKRLGLVMKSSALSPELAKEIGNGEAQRS